MTGTTGRRVPPATWTSCTVIDDFLGKDGFQALLAGIGAATSGLATASFSLDRYMSFFNEALVRAVSETWVGLDWVGAETGQAAFALDFELRQIDPCESYVWDPVCDPAGAEPAKDRFVLTLYALPLEAGQMTVWVGASASDPSAHRVRARANRAVFLKSSAAVVIPAFGPPLADCAQDIFIMKGQLR